MQHNSIFINVLLALSISLFTLTWTFVKPKQTIQQSITQGHQVGNLAFNDEQLIAEVKNALSEMYKKVDYGSFNSSNENGMTTLTGSAEIFKEAVSLSCQFTAERKLKKIKIGFGPGKELNNRDFKRFAYKETPGDHFPRELQKAMIVKEIGVGFDENTKKPNEMTVHLASNQGWKLFSAGVLTLNNVEGQITISQPEGSKRVTASLGGNFTIDGTKINLTATGGNAPEDWAFRTKIQNLSITSIIKSVMGSTAFTGIHLPNKMTEVKVESAELYIAPKNKIFTFKGNTSLGQGELTIKPEPNSDKLGFLVGFSPANLAQEFRSISPELFTAVDALQMNNFGFVLSSFDDNGNTSTSLDVFKKLGGSTKISKGLNFVGYYDLTQYGLNKLLNVNSAFLNAVISSDPSKMWFSAGIKSSIRLGNEAEIKEVVLYLKPNPSSFECQIGGVMDLRLQNQILKFKSQLIVNVTNQSLAFQGTLSGGWKDPFGAKGLTIDILGLRFGASFTSTPIPLPELGLAGEIKLGNFKGDLRVLVNSRNPSQSAIDVGFNQINMNEIVTKFCRPEVLSSIPANMRNTVLNMQFSNARLTVVPQDMTLFEKAYKAGFRIAGDVKVAEMGSKLDVKIDYNNGIDASAEVNKIEYSPYFKLAGANGQGNPGLRVVLKPSTVPIVAIEGSVEVLKMQRTGSMFINDQGFSIALGGKIFSKFEGNAVISGSRVKDGGSFRAAVTLEQNFLKYFSEEASRDIDQASKDSQAKFLIAQKDLTKWRNELNRLDVNINAAREKANRDRQNNINNLNAAKNKVTSAENAVANHQAKINQNAAKIAAEEKITMDKWKWADAVKISNPIEWVKRKAIATDFAASREASIIAPLRVANASLYTQLGVVKAAVITANGALDVAKRTYKIIPVDEYPEVSSLIKLKAITQGSLDAANLTVKGAGFATQGSFTAAKWIVENGNPMGIVDVNYAHFEGQLSAVNGEVVTLHLKGKYAGNPFDRKITFDFKNMLGDIQKFADSLMK